mgnify:CR=1 FL=1|jgi:Outer membrane receptor proteins, mostly Fe transport
MKGINQAKFIVFLVVILFFGSYSANGQQKNSLTGTVTDPSGAAVAGAFVTAVNSQGVKYRTVTDDLGKFSFKDLPKGSFQIVVTANGFDKASRSVNISVSKVAEVNFQLSLASVGAVVTVKTENERIELERAPGATELVDRREIQQTQATNLKSVLYFAPGVLVQPRFGSDESQISIRGSGLRNNYHLRGVNLFINNLPYGDADGFSDFESLEFLTAQRVEVWKGANALRFGGNTAGGAINLVTENGETAFPLEIRFQGGSFGSFKGYVSTGGTRGRFGYFVGVSDSEYDGYREHSGQGRRRLFGNFTFKPNENTDIYADVVFANFAEYYPGALTYSELKTDPRQAVDEYVTNNWSRFANYYRGALGVKHRIGRRHEVSFNASIQYRDLVHPIFQWLDQDTRTFTGEFRYVYTGVKNRFTIGFIPQLSTREERRFENVLGVRGDKVNHVDQTAVNYGLYFENQYDLTPRLTFVAGGRFDYAKRRSKDLFLSDGDQSDRRFYRVFSPKIGLVFRATENASVFANVSRSYEPPILGELTSYGAPGFLPLEAQDTVQTEIGARGSLLDRRLNYEISFFNWAVSNEIINLNVVPFPGAPFTIPSYRNAPKTRHAGFELSFDAVPAKNLFAENDSLSWRNAYTFADFKFTKDANYKGNYIPGQPKHLLRSELRYDHPKGFWVAPNLDWSPSDYFVDSANTFRNESYAVFNFRAGFDRRKYGIFFEAQNLTNRIYSPSVVVDDAAGRFYEPGNGRSAFVGFYYRFDSK